MDKLGQNAQNVVTMSDYQPETGFAAIAQTEAYWEALRRNRLLPKRSEIDPRGIEQALEYAFILERIAPGIARLRIAGSHLNDLMGMEVRGMPLTTFFTPAHRRQISDTLEEVFQSPATCTLHLTSPATSGRKAVEARMLLLPLKSDLGDVSRILGCFVSHGEIGIAPRRFETTHLDLRPILPGLGSVPKGLPAQGAPAKPTDTDSPRPPAGFAAPATNFGVKGNKRRPPYLRLIKTDE